MFPTIVEVPIMHKIPLPKKQNLYFWRLSLHRFRPLNTPLTPLSEELEISPLLCVFKFVVDMNTISYDMLNSATA